MENFIFYTFLCFKFSTVNTYNFGNPREIHIIFKNNYPVNVTIITMYNLKHKGKVKKIHTG